MKILITKAFADFYVCFVLVSFIPGHALNLSWVLVAHPFLLVMASSLSSRLVWIYISVICHHLLHNSITRICNDKEQNVITSPTFRWSYPCKELGLSYICKTWPNFAIIEVKKKVGTLKSIDHEIRNIQHVKILDKKNSITNWCLMRICNRFSRILAGRCAYNEIMFHNIK